MMLGVSSTGCVSELLSRYSRAIFCLKSKLFSSNTKSSLRTHTCGELRESDVGKSVTLCGWLYNTRVSSSFLLVKDAYGITQVTLEPNVRVLHFDYVLVSK